jgi:hypothetical protein
MKIKTKLERRAMHIHLTQKKQPLEEWDRRCVVQSLRCISVLAEFAARIIESESASIKTHPRDDDWIDVARMSKTLWTTAGKDRFRLTHAGMAILHAIHNAGDGLGSRLPNLEELGFKIR